MITIIGAGIVGPTIALYLAKAGMSVNLIDFKNPFEEKTSPQDLRAISIAYGCKIFFDEIGLWEKLDDIAQPIWEIRVLEKDSVYTLDFEGEEHPLGFIVEYGFLRKAMTQALNHASIQCYFGEKVDSIHYSELEAQITLVGGQVLFSNLVIGADGKSSIVRQNSKIQASFKDCNDIALVGTVLHETPHHNTAWEVFFPKGMLAFLPMPSLENQNRSSFVYFQKKGTDFSKIFSLNEVFQDIFPYYGTLNVQEETSTHPIISMKTNELIDHRLAIVGDAAHVLHPILGQGANLGWCDAKILCEELAQAFSIGLDVGSHIVLERYQQKRKLEHTSLHFSTKALRAIFDCRYARFARNAGFSIINKTPFLKKWITNKAMKLS
jgi:2-octaprenyl-6-methoxyphenol hydroxylase